MKPWLMSWKSASEESICRKEEEEEEKEIMLVDGEEKQKKEREKKIFLLTHGLEVAKAPTNQTEARNWIKDE